MKIENVTLATSDMTIEEIDTLIKKLKQIRTRRGDARNYYNQFTAMVNNMREEGYCFCDTYTGEVLNPEHFVVYDNQEDGVQYGTARWEID